MNHDHANQDVMGKGSLRSYFEIVVGASVVLVRHLYAEESGRLIPLPVEGEDASPGPGEGVGGAQLDLRQERQLGVDLALGCRD